MPNISMKKKYDFLPLGPMRCIPRKFKCFTCMLCTASYWLRLHDVFMYTWHFSLMPSYHLIHLYVIIWHETFVCRFLVFFLWIDLSVFGIKRSSVLDYLTYLNGQVFHWFDFRNNFDFWCLIWFLLTRIQIFQPCLMGFLYQSSSSISKWTIEKSDPLVIVMNMPWNLNLRQYTAFDLEQTPEDSSVFFGVYQYKRYEN